MSGPFKVGQRVRVTNCLEHFHKVGDVGTITRAHGGFAGYIVKVGDKAQHLCGDQIELVADTPADRIAALEAELAAIKAQLNVQQPQALSPLDAMLHAYSGEWVAKEETITHGCDNLILSCLDLDDAGHTPAMVRAIAAIPAMIAAMRAVNADYFAHVGEGECLPPAASAAWVKVRAALTAAGDTP